ncbi:GNAT family N-acetyltransferase [Gemmatimonas sp.]
MEKIALRRATLADIAPLNALIHASVRRLAVGFYDAQQIESSLRHMFGVDSQLVNDGTYFVIEVDRALAACGGWSARQTLFGGDQHKAADHHGSDAPVDPAVVPARIRAFFVHPDYARRGLARRLYEHCAAEAAQAGFVSLELMGTLPGVPLYRALGFETLETVGVELPDGVVVPCERMRIGLNGETRD